MSEEKQDDNYAYGVKKTVRPPEELHNLHSRLNRIIGQVNGIKRLLDENAYCTDLLIQVAAAQGAFYGFTRELITSHIKTCVADDIRAGKEETVDELIQTLYKLMR